jgi:hypothetical protein
MEVSWHQFAKILSLWRCNRIKHGNNIKMKKAASFKLFSATFAAVGAL